MTDKDNMGARMVPLYAARIEDLAPGDFVKVDCSRVFADGTALFLDRLGLSPRNKVLDLKDRVRCRRCGARGGVVMSIKWGKPAVRSRLTASTQRMTIWGKDEEYGLPQRLIFRPQSRRATQSKALPGSVSPPDLPRPAVQRQLQRSHTYQERG
jgi:hypothetical protein